MKKLKILLVLLAIATCVIFLAIILKQPWQREIKVLNVTIPKSNEIIELWEKPYFNITCLCLEYTTWLRMIFPNGSDKWYLIEYQYIIFRKVSVYLSADKKRIRIENTSDSGESYMIAEYNLEKDIFVSKGEKSIKNDKSWNLLIEKVIRRDKRTRS